MAQSIPTLEVVVLSEGELPFRHGLDSCWLGDSMKNLIPSKYLLSGL